MASPVLAIVVLLAAPHGGAGVPGRLGGHVRHESADQLAGLPALLAHLALLHQFRQRHAVGAGVLTGLHGRPSLTLCLLRIQEPALWQIYNEPEMRFFRFNYGPEYDLTRITAPVVLLSGAPTPSRSTLDG
jgi:hypothetical protein